jgi:hypothetical protein
VKNATEVSLDICALAPYARSLGSRTETLGALSVGHVCHVPSRGALDFPRPRRAALFGRPQRPAAVRLWHATPPMNLAHEPRKCLRMSVSVRLAMPRRAGNGLFG